MSTEAFVTERGVVQVPNFATERIKEAITTFAHRPFSIQEVHEQVPDIPRHTVTSVVGRKEKMGYLERIAHGVYRDTAGICIKTSLPSGLIANALWMVLFTDPGRRFKRLAELVCEVEEYIGRENVSVYHQVSTTLSRWYRGGFLDRTGPHLLYAYRLKEGIVERPVTTY